MIECDTAYEVVLRLLSFIYGKLTYNSTFTSISSPRYNTWAAFRHFTIVASDLCLILEVFRVRDAFQRKDVIIQEIAVYSTSILVISLSRVYRKPTFFAKQSSENIPFISLLHICSVIHVG